jgi:putative peptide zinc metalloprotease protein
LVWVNKDVTLNRNEAYAFAGCRTCKAVAIAFQVVLVVGEAHVVAPQNIAAAVSYHCFACVTQALAAQLVVTVPRRLSPEAMRQLAVIWTQAVVLERHLGGMTFAQIRSAIASVERQILAVVAPELTPTGPAPGVADGSASSTSAGAPTGAPTGAPATPTDEVATPSDGTSVATPPERSSSQSSPSPSQSESTTPVSSPTPTASTTSSQ